MPRTVRIEYEGAKYHVMCRGDRREAIFWGEADREMFLGTLWEACARTGAEIYSYVLMGNHYHLLLGTPHGNLVATMRWFQGTYTARFNARHKQRGHVFQGRYKAIPVDGSEPEYARRVSDYIHLNPVRAGTVNAKRPSLLGYRWSSVPDIVAGGKVSRAFRAGEVMAWHGWSRSRRADRKAFADYLQQRAEENWRDGANKSRDEDWADIKRGWYVGGEEFRARLESLASAVVSGGRRDSYAPDALGAHDQATATRLLKDALQRLDLTTEDLLALRKSDPRKQAVAWLLKSNTTVSDAWVCAQIGMGNRSNISRAVSRFRRVAPPREISKLQRLLHVCTD